MRNNIMNTEIWIKAFVYINGDANLIQGPDETTLGSFYRIRNVCGYAYSKIDACAEFAYYIVDLVCNCADGKKKISIALNASNWETRLGPELRNCIDTGATATCKNSSSNDVQKVADAIQQNNSITDKAEMRIYRII